MKNILLLSSTFTLLTACGAGSSLRTLHDSVFGGTEVAENDPIAQRTVALLIAGPEGEGSCSAVLVAEDMVLTAAHCIESEAGYTYKISFGVDISSDTRIERDVVALESNERWDVLSNEYTNLHDIALLRFAGGLPEGYVPAKMLPFRTDIRNEITVTIAGYGISDLLSWEGTGRLRSAEVQVLNAYFSETEIQVDNSQRRGGCVGDSGGPAFIEIQGELFLWGITSRGEPGCETTAVYTSVADYFVWIAVTMQKLRNPPTVEDCSSCGRVMSHNLEDR